MSDSVTFQPSRKAKLTIFLITSFIWGLGLVGLAQSPWDLNAWGALALALLIIGYVATERIMIADDRISFWRYFITRSDAPLQGVRLVRAFVGRPRLIKGLAFEDTQTGERIAEIVASNYSGETIQELEQLLANGGSP